ncbi:hypothetical protein ACW0US_18150 [Xanthomonas euvesicatoria]
MNKALAEQLFDALKADKVDNASIGQLNWHPKNREHHDPIWYVTAFSTPDFAMAVMRHPVDLALLDGEKLTFETDNYTRDAVLARRIRGSAAAQHLIVY